VTQGTNIVLKLGGEFCFLVYPIKSGRSGFLGMYLGVWTLIDAVSWVTGRTSGL